MISVKNLTIKFDVRGIAGLHGINFTVGDKQMCAVLGPNGSGKSTLLKLLAGMITKDAGEIKTSSAVKMVTLQEPVAEMSVANYLVSKVSVEMNDEKKMQLARDMADIFEFTSQFRQNISSLSSGQKQKVLLAADIIDHPQVILLDEPFAHLDPFTRTDILIAFKKYLHNRECTVLWVSHDIAEASRFSHQLLLLQHGSIAQAGTPAELHFHPRNLFVAQFMGHENFMVVKKDGLQWTSPWGSFSLSGPDIDEALLIIPQDSWVTQAHGLPFEIKETYPRQNRWCHVGECSGQVFTVYSPTILGQVGSRVLIQPKFTDCLIIPL